VATTEPAEPVDPVAEASQQPGRARRRVALGVGMFLLLVLGVFGVDAVRSASSMFEGIRSARSSLDAGAESLFVGDPRSAIVELAAAADEADAAVSTSERPSMRLLGLLPIVGQNVRATRAVATAIGDCARAGIVMGDAAESLGWNSILLPGARSIGHVNVPKIRRATLTVDDVSSRLQDALDRLRAAGSGDLFGPVASGYHDALVALERRVALTTDLGEVFHLLPPMFGGEGARRYLLGVESLDIPRGTGGVISSIGVLAADHGHLTLTGLQPAPDVFARTNASPDFPTDAPAMLEAARFAGLGSLDGVILVDSVGLQDMLWMTGPVSTVFLKRPVTMDTGVNVLERKLFLGTDADLATQRQADVSDAVLDGFLAQRPSLEAFTIGMAQAISERHLMVWTRSAPEMSSLADLGATGRFDPARGSLMVVWRGAARNRAISYMRRTTAEFIRLDENGVATIETDVGIDDRAPTAPPSLLLGLDGRTGMWRGRATVYLPPGAGNVSAMTSSGGAVVKGQDLGASVVTGPLQTSPGSSDSMNVVYRQHGAAVHDGSVWRYEVVVLPQPAIVPMPVEVQINLPPGMSLVAKANRLMLDGGTLIYQGAPEAPLTLWVTYR
jgi:hypothetical protein